MGHSNLNFYKILSKNDAKILKQSSKIFQIYNPLFNRNVTQVPNSTEISNLNLIKCHIFEDIQNPFTEDVIFKGNVIGKMDGLIEIKKIPLIKQIMCGVHTENGFDISSIYLHNVLSPSTILNKGNPLREIPQELKFFITQKLNLIDKFFPSPLKNLEEKKQPENSNTQINNNLVNGILSNNFDEKKNENNNNQNLLIDCKVTLNLLNEIKTTLKKSCKESLLIYNLSNESDIILAQREMIDLGINLINILQKEDVIDSRRSAIFEILILLFNRAEIDLRLMAFDYKNPPSLEKIEVCRDFIDFLNKVLSYCLDKLAAGKSADLDTNEFVEFFLSVSYFRLPMFRQVFIQTINSGINENETYEILRFLDKENEYDNLVGGNGEVNDSNSERAKINDINIVKEIDVNPVNSLIDWETLFYERIEKFSKNKNDFNKEFQEISDKLKETENILISHEWKLRISKRGNAFFSMIMRLEKYIQSKVILLRNLRWTKIPGFKFIISSIVHELRSRDVSQYQEPLVKLLTIFINDSDISNLFINTIIKKTK